MEQEYKVGLFGKIFYGLLAGGIVGFLLLMLISKPPNEAIVYLIVLIPVAIGILIILNLFKSKVIVTETSITRQRLFYNRTLNFDDIKGVRIESKIIIIEPLEASYSQLKISNYDDLAKSEELTKWLREKFTDLDNKDREAEKEKLLHDNSLGYTVEERTSKIDKMGQIAIAYSVWGFIMFFILIFVRNHNLSFWAGILYPALGLAIMSQSNGLIKFASDSQRSNYWGISIGFCMPIVLLLVTAITQFELHSISRAWPIMVTVTLIFFILLYTLGINKNNRFIVGQVFGMLFISIIFGLGSVTLTNCLFDNSKPVKYQTQVVDEYISNSKGAHYHLKLKPWLPGQNIREVDVSEKSYYKTPVGSTVFIYQKKGLLNIPWFDFELDPTPPVPAGSNNGNSLGPR
nr:hypothetical protein [Mucilaginibacter sp. L294]